MRWKIEGSDDRVYWEGIASFHSAEIAQRVFDLELVLIKRTYLRLVDPNGVVQERAKNERPQ